MRTNRSTKGWISADRRTSLLSNLQYLVENLSRLQKICANNNSKLRFEFNDPAYTRTSQKLLNELDPKVYLFSFIIDWTLLFSMDSDLEAFSHNPTHGSVTALAVQLTVFTNYVIQRFLSYWIELLSQYYFISRVKLTCLTTV